LGVESRFALALSERSERASDEAEMRKNCRVDEGPKMERF
jgi:hypothetical protein